MSININTDRKYFLNNECIVSSLITKEKAGESVLSDLLVPSYELFKDRDDKFVNEISSISNDLYIAEDPMGSRGLSGKVEFLLRMGKNSMEYAGELNEISYVTHEGKLTCFVSQGDDTKAGEFLKRGKWYRINCNTPKLSDEIGITKALLSNDYFFVKEGCKLSDLTFDNMAMIRDSQAETEYLQKWVNDNFLHLSGGDMVENVEYFNEISSRSITADKIDALTTDIGVISVDTATIACEFVGDSKINNLSVGEQNILSIIHDKIENRVETLSIETVNLEGSKVLKTLGQKDGIISVTTRDILSDDIVGLSNFVANEINLSLDVLDFEGGEEGKFILSVKQVDGKITTTTTSKVTNDYIEDNTIAQGKITDLTSDLENISTVLSTVVRRNSDDVSLKGDLSCYTHGGMEPCHDFRHFLHHNISEDEGYEIKRGFMYRNVSRWELSNGSEIKILDSNEYIIARENTYISAAEFGSFNYIRDYDFDISSVNQTIDGMNFNISVENGKIIDHVIQVSGQISATTRTLLSSDVSGLVEYVADRIDDKVKSLDCEDMLSTKTDFVQTITKLNEDDGKIGYEFEDLNYNRISGLVEYIEEQVTISGSYLSTWIGELSSKVDDLCVNISNDVSVNRQNIADLSTDYHEFYDNTFTELSNTDPSLSCVKSHVLKVTDETHVTEPGEHDQYVLTFLSGTMVMRKI